MLSICAGGHDQYRSGEGGSMKIDLRPRKGKGNMQKILILFFLPWVF